MDSKDFADLKLKAECSRIVLTNVGNNAISVSGPGEIWQDEDGALQYKIFISTNACQNLRAHMLQPRTIGQLIPDGDYFILEAQEYNSVGVSTSRRVMPDSRSGIGGALVYGRLQEMTHAEAIPNYEFGSILLRIKGKVAFPCNQGTQTVVRVGGQEREFSNAFNVAFFDDGDYRFEIRHEREHTVVSLKLPANGLNAATSSRIHEAFQFLLGRQLPLVVIETASAGSHVFQLISPLEGNGRTLPPLMFNQFNQGEHVWPLFVRYFRHIHGNAACGLHPISRHISSVLESMAGSIDVGVLALAVVVEGLAGECFPNLAPVAQAFLTELDSIQGALGGLNLVPATRNRIEGSINAMRRPRNSDLIRAFLSANHLPGGLYNSWSRLRNTSAHGGGIGNRDIETILRLRNEALSLMYSVIFAAINYTGQRTDYSLAGWPRVAWPPPQQAVVV